MDPSKERIPPPAPLYGNADPLPPMATPPQPYPSNPYSTPYSSPNQPSANLPNNAPNQKGRAQSAAVLFISLLAIAGTLVGSYIILHTSKQTVTYTSGAGTSSSAKYPQTSTFSVSATLFWQDTGVALQAGDQVTITYVSGTWRYAPTAPASDGTGPPEQYICANHYPVASCQLPDPHYVLGALVGKVQSQIVDIGDSLSFVAQQSGELQLAINDGYVSDNSGSIVVQITNRGP